MDEQQQQRRHDDRDRMLNEKLDHIERDNQTLQKAVTALETTVNVVKLEQTHMKELFDARFKIVEAAQALQLSEIKQLAKDIQTMTSDVDKSPATRMLQQQIHEQTEKVTSHEQAHQLLRDWQNRVDGVLLFLKWIGATGLLVAAAALLKAFGGG